MAQVLSILPRWGAAMLRPYRFGSDASYGSDGSCLHHASACNLEFSLEYDSYRFGIDPVFFRQDSFGERSVGVFVFHRDDGLKHDRSGVEIFVDEMNRATGEF